MDIVVHAETEVAATPLAVFEYSAVPGHFHELFTGCGPIPAVTEVAMKTGGPTGPGSQRAIHNSDGSVLTEEVLVWEPGKRHGYRLIDGFRPPGSWLFSGAEGEWVYRESGNGTAVQWTYCWSLRHWLCWPVGALIIGVFFQRAMQQALDNLKIALNRR